MKIWHLCQNFISAFRKNTISFCSGTYTQIERFFKKDLILIL